MDDEKFETVKKMWQDIVNGLTHEEVVELIEFIEKEEESGNSKTKAVIPKIPNVVSNQPKPKSNNKLYESLATKFNKDFQKKVLGGEYKISDWEFTGNPHEEDQFYVYIKRVKDGKSPTAKECKDLIAKFSELKWKHKKFEATVINESEKLKVALYPIAD